MIQSRLQGRLRFIAGDFFQQALPEADVLIMGHLLHDWNLQEKQLLIRKAYEALPSDGALIAYDAIIDDDRSENAAGLLMSLNMLIETHAILIGGGIAGLAAAHVIEVAHEPNTVGIYTPT